MMMFSVSPVSAASFSLAPSHLLLFDCLAWAIAARSFLLLRAFSHPVFSASMDRCLIIRIFIRLHAQLDLLVRSRPS